MGDRLQLSNRTLTIAFFLTFTVWLHIMQTLGSLVNYEMETIVSEEVEARLDHVQHHIRAGLQKSKGVNLGGWLVAEYWMTYNSDIWTQVNSNAASKGEYFTIIQSTNPDLVREKFDLHHATFITEKDIAEIHQLGFNTVRVPIGYWIACGLYGAVSMTECEVYSNNAIKYLDLLVTSWAKIHNIAVLVEIHAAEGSQNGMDHSSPTLPGKSMWGHSPEYVNNTIQLAKFFANRYNNEVAFLGLGLLNEPAGDTSREILYQYYKDTYTEIRNTGNNCILVVSPLLWEQGPDHMQNIFNSPTYTNVWVEWHPYFIWGFEHVTEEDLLNIVNKSFSQKISDWNERLEHNPLFAGEWSFATAGKFTTANLKEMYYEFCQSMLLNLDKMEGGWTYWSWRVQNDERGLNAWSLRSVLRDERIRYFFSQVL